MMKPKTALLFLALLPFLFFRGYSQLSINLFGGPAYYFGELNHGLNPKNSGFTAGLGVRYLFASGWGMEAGYSNLFLRGNDKYSKNTTEQARNLHFRTRIDEFKLLAVYSPVKTGWRIKPVIGAGPVSYFFNPQAMLSGHWYDLQPLGTEGQYLPTCADCPPPYRTIKLGLLLTGGADLRLTQRLSLSFRLSHRKLFTDFLDDVSGVYPNMGEVNAYNPTTFLMSWRGDATLTNPFSVSGTPRGNPKNKDAYTSCEIGITLQLGPRKE
jgi:hypothetical protein